MAQTDGTIKTVGEDTYQIRMLDPQSAADLLMDLMDVFAPALANIGGDLLRQKDTGQLLRQLKGALQQDEQAPAEDGGLDLLSEAASNLADGLEKAIDNLVQRLDKAKLRQTIAMMRTVTAVRKDGPKGEAWPELDRVFDAHFRGRPKAMFAWLYAALAVQFQDFF